MQTIYPTFVNTTSKKLIVFIAVLMSLLFSSLSFSDCKMPEDLPTGDLGIIIERMDGSVLIINNSSLYVLCRIEGQGDLSHASAVFSRDARYAFVFGRDGGLTKIDLLKGDVIYLFSDGFIERENI